MKKLLSACLAALLALGLFAFAGCDEGTSVGEDTDPEPTAAEYAELMEQVSVEAVLKAAMLDGLYTAADCRLIPPEEYDQKYGEEQA